MFQNGHPVVVNGENREDEEAEVRYRSIVTTVPTIFDTAGIQALRKVYREYGWPDNFDRKGCLAAIEYGWPDNFDRKDD